jgi:sensor histidine kinase regulating citrate/malate metabolism
MLKTIRTMLRTRLALLAAFAVLALLIALFVAWGFARATETFAVTASGFISAWSGT